MVKDFGSLTRRILHLANRGAPRIDFFREISDMLMGFSGCEALELRVKHGDLHYRWRAERNAQTANAFDLIPGRALPDGRTIPCVENGDILERLCGMVLSGEVNSALSCFTKAGSFWAADFDSLKKELAAELLWSEQAAVEFKSVAIIPFTINDLDIGLVLLKSRRPGIFSLEAIEFYEGVAQTLGMAVADRRAQAALHERMKELTCLYGISQVIEREGLAFDEMLQQIVDLLPPAMQYPEHSMAMITLDQRAYTTAGFRSSPHKLMAEISVKEHPRGLVEVIYSESISVPEPAMFLPEEQHLIDAVARQVALIIERREAEIDKAALQNQLRHADRLATLGQLAAGVAHELNEPLSSILGYAQLVKKSAPLSAESGRDIDKIVASSLHAREIIKKLLLFGRQTPPKKTLVNLNQVVTDGLYLLDARFVKEGIELARRLAPNLPEIVADPGQLHQVFINLVVNAVQAMPAGGRLTIETLAREDSVSLVVDDTGVGMNEEILRQIFVPFFTTKDVGQGTGLGLPVVHGIVTAHGGNIKVNSEPGKGSRFEVILPVKPEEVGLGQIVSRKPSGNS